MMNVVCIGAGRLAHHLMPELQRAGCNIIQVYNRTQWPAVLLAKRLHAASHITDLAEIDTTADLYFLTIADDAIKDISHQLASVHDIQGIGIHCSGVLEMNVLQFDRRAVFYPLQTFSEHHEVEWNEIPIILTSENEEVTQTLKMLALKISSRVYEVSDEQKTYIHLAAVIANNFTNHMLTIAENICMQHNISFDILKPLVELTVQKALESGPAISQTGPAVRGDEQTIEKHLELLKSDPVIFEVYQAITKSIKKS